MKPRRNTSKTTPSNSISTEGEKLWIDEKGILQSEVFPVYLTREHALAAIEAMQQLANGQRKPTLVDMRNAIGTSNEARKCYSGEEGAAVISACAMLIDSPLSRIMGNFYLGLNKTLFPFKLFTNKQKAIVWLKQYL